MGRAICKIPHEGKDYYLLWSTVVDAFITVGMELEEFNSFMRSEEGDRYMREQHPGRMERVKAQGTSSRMCSSVEDVITCNRCGPGEKRLSMEGIVFMYITKRGQDVTNEEMSQYYEPYTKEEIGEEEWEEWGRDASER